MFICGADHAGFSATDGKDVSRRRPPRATTPVSMRRVARPTACRAAAPSRHGSHHQPHCLAGEVVGVQLHERYDGHRWRSGLRWPCGRPLHGAGFIQRQAAVELPDRRRRVRFGQHLRAWRQAVCCGAVRRQCDRAEQAWRQRVAVLRWMAPWSRCRRRRACLHPPLPEGARGAGAGAVQQGVVLPQGTPNLATGAAQYRTLCMGCHGENGLGGQNNGGVSLATIARTPQLLADTAWNGKNNMPPFRDSLTPEQMRDIAYLHLRAASAGVHQ